MRAWRMGWAVVALAAASPAPAFFESSQVGTRALALADNFVSVADDASALYWNPAGLVRLARHEALFTLDYSPELEGLSQSYAGTVLHTRPLSLGVGWSALRLEDALQEDLFYFSVSRLLVRRALGAFIAAGATLKVAHVGVDPVGLGSVSGLRRDQSGFAADVGLLLSPIPNVTVGAALRNIGRPEFDLVEGGIRTTLEDEVEWGLSLRWIQDSALHFSRVQHPGGENENKLGLELDIGDVLDVRLGLASDVVSGGIGVSWKSWQFESSFRAHDELGLGTRVGLKFAFGAERREGGPGD